MTRAPPKRDIALYRATVGRPALGGRWRRTAGDYMSLARSWVHVGECSISQQARDSKGDAYSTGALPDTRSELEPMMREQLIRYFRRIIGADQRLCSWGDGS